MCWNISVDDYFQRVKKYIIKFLIKNIDNPNTTDFKDSIGFLISLDEGFKKQLLDILKNTK